MKPQPPGTGCVHCARPDQWGASSGLRPRGAIPEAITVIIPHPRKDIYIGTLRFMIRLSGLSKELFDQSLMKPEDRYHRFVRWSYEDRCYIGYGPDVYYGGCCNGDQKEPTYAGPCAIVRDKIAHWLRNGETLPTSASVRATHDLDFAAA